MRPNDDDAAGYIRAVGASMAQASAAKGLPSTLRDALRQAARRACKRSLPVDIDEDFLVDLVEAQGARCAVSGIRFNPLSGPLKRSPYGVSIDRADSSKGYVRGNVRLVCLAVNLALGEWGDDVLLLIARAVCEKRGRRREIVAVQPPGSRAD